MKQKICEKIKIFHLDITEPKHKKAFMDLNIEWLERYFVVEDIDKIILSNPEKIINNEGFILLVEYEREIIGTISLIKAADGEYELSKMAITERFQGFGIANHLMREFFEISKEKTLQKIYIASNRKLIPAITLYKKYGFIESSEDRHSLFERGDITMECVL